MFVWNGASDFVIFTNVKNQFLRGRPRTCHITIKSTFEKVLLLTKVDQAPRIFFGKRKFIFNN